ncbi:MAG: histone deacetylase, partial [Anaerolineae bacterium]|nr:histone deacetylase [Anaerolineae bacterium]
TFPLPLPPRHLFPVRKYGLLRRALLDAGIVQAGDMAIAPEVTDAQILLAHDAGYLQRVQEGRLTEKELRRIGMPWSAEYVTRVRRATGGTIAACRAALQDGVAVNLAGGYHHAFHDYGQGFCLLNDIVIAARVMQAEGLARQVAVLDCDVHQGNGTAALAADDPTIYTFSIHSESNFPLHKPPSNLDIALEDGADAAAFLAALDGGLCQSLEEAQADLALYLAGADPYEDDLLGHLALSKEGLAQRDRLVLEHCRRRQLPVAVLLAGGYGRLVEDTVEIHRTTVHIAAKFAATWPAGD